MSRRINVVLEKEESTSAADLTYLNLSFERVGPGLPDFVAEVTVMQSDKEQHRVLIRGSRETAKADGADKVAKAIIRTFAEKKEPSFHWEKANTEYLSKMLAPHIKYFCLNVNISRLVFITDALK